MIYVMEEFDGTTSIFKIGVTTKQGPAKRLRQVRRERGNLYPITLVAGLMGNEADERFWHSAFSKHRLHGEWFGDCPGIRKLIQDFPFHRWDTVMSGLGQGTISKEEAYTELTLLKFEPDHIKFKALELLHLQWS